MLRIVHITPGKSRLATRDDPLGRSWLGYDPQRSAAENWEVNRVAWSLDPERVQGCDLAVFSHNGLVVFVAQVSGVQRVPDIGGYKGRWSLAGSLVPGHSLAGRPQPVARSFGNPIAYGSIRPS